MKISRNILGRPAALISAIALLTASFLPLLNSSIVSAATTQVTTRSIEPSNSTVSATGVSYKVSFTAQSSTGLSLILDFCQDSPIIGAACSTTNGVTFTSPALTGSNLPTGMSTVTSTGSTLKIAGTTNALVSGTPYTFTVTGVNNPTGTAATPGAVGTYYARLYSFTTNTFGTYASAGSPGNYSDYGGFALSTDNNINISATVQEQLTFCVSGTTMTAGCAGMSTPALTLGSGSPITLGTALSTAPAYTQTSTNALTGVVVRMKTNNACGGLSRDGGTTCPIAAVNSGSATPAAINTGDGKFGMYLTAGSANTTASAPYAGGTTTYGMDTTSANNNVISTYGSSIFTSSGALSNENDTLTFGAAAATTTPAGVYIATMILIATGTF